VVFAPPVAPQTQSHPQLHASPSEVKEIVKESEQEKAKEEGDVERSWKTKST
jgi:ribosomal silencing factor RsfS